MKIDVTQKQVDVLSAFHDLSYAEKTLAYKAITLLYNAAMEMEVQRTMGMKVIEGQDEHS